MLFAIALKSVFIMTDSMLVHKLMMVNIWIALFHMLPIPPYNGARTFFGSRFVYVFVVGALIGCGFLLSYVGGLASLIGAIIFGIILLLVFFAHVDKRW